MRQEELEVLEVGRRNLDRNQRCLHRLRQPSPLQRWLDELRCNASLQGQSRVNQSFRGHRLVEPALKMIAPYEQVHRKLLSHRAGATYPLLHQQHVRSLHGRALDEGPYRPSGARCGGELALNHRAHQEVHVNK